MSKVSTITVEGFLAQDVEVRQTNAGAVAEVTVPHTRRKKNQQTQQWEDAGATTWFKAAFWKDDIARVQGLKKGTPVILMGELGEVRAYVKSDNTAGANVTLLFASIGVAPAKQSQGQASQPSGDVWGAPGGYNDDQAVPF